MSSRGSIFGVLLALLAACHPGPQAAAGSVKGSVVDPGTDQGIAAVVVKLRQSDGSYLGVQGATDAGGAFTVDQVPDGTYVVVLDKVGYVPRPDPAKTVTVGGSVDAGRLSLLQALASAEYYQNLAAKIAARAPADGDRKAKAYGAFWNRLRAINLPPSSKAMFAAGLAERDESVTRSVPEIGEYAKAKPEDIRKAELAFERAVTGGESLPSPPGFTDAEPGLKIGPTVIADLVLQQARNTAVSNEKRTAFSKEFAAKWEGSDAAKVFAEYQKAGLDKNLVLPPDRRRHEAENASKKEYRD